MSMVIVTPGTGGRERKNNGSGTKMAFPAGRSIFHHPARCTLTSFVAPPLAFAAAAAVDRDRLSLLGECVRTTPVQRFARCRPSAVVPVAPLGLTQSLTSASRRG